MATSLLSNLLYTSNDTDPRDNASQNILANPLNDAERRKIVDLLEASVKCIEEGTCGPVVYQTMGALHQYTAMCAGLTTREKAEAITRPCKDEQRPAFVNTNSSLEQSEHEDALAYGWVEELSHSADEDSLRSVDVTWNSVLALLVQKEEDDEPCLWITKEVLATISDDEEVEEYEVRDETIKSSRISQPSTELETLHSIPLRRRLRSCFYQNFYGDHRLVLELKRFGASSSRRSSKNNSSSQKSNKKKARIVLRCPSAASAKAWVDCLAKARKKKSQTDATHANIEVEMVDQSPSNEFGESSCDESTHRRRHRIVNVIDSEDDDEEDYGIPNNSSIATVPARDVSPKRLAEKLQEREDRKRATLQEEARQKKLKAKEETEKLEKAKLAALEQQKKEALERKKQEDVQQKRLEAIEKNVESTSPKATASSASPSKQPVKHKPMTAAEKQQQRMEREIAARKRAEEERRRIEIEYEQQKKERVEQRRRDLEAKRKLAREEQKRKEQIQKQKFLESERRKEAMKAAAMKAPTKKVAKGVFNTKSNSTKSNTSNEKGNLWYSLNKHMSAFETADEERKRKEAEKREEEKAKAEAKQDEEDPELVRKRIAEQARQRLVQDEVGKLRKEAEAASKLNGGGFSSPKGSTSPHASVSPTTSQHSHQMPQASISPTGPAHHKSASNSVPSVPPLHHPQTQSWNKVQQPPYPPQYSQQAPFQRSQAPSMGAAYPPSGAYPNTVPSNPPYPHHQQSRQQQPQMPSTQPHTTSHSAHQRTKSPPQQPAMEQQAPQPPPQASNAEFSESTLKKNVLIQWGLHPPNMQVLKPVDQLLCSIHGVFPPSFGVASHDYFSGWKAIDRSELVSSDGILDETKLKKSVRKVRFFLHPDKLPHDLTEEQNFLCKLLWDVINDAFEEYKRSKEALDWM